MSDASSAIRNLRERLADGTEDRLGKALTELLENPVLTGVVGHAFDARERAAQAQELAMGVLNIPSAADIERLTRRLRSVSQRLEGIEDGVHRLDRALSGRGVDRSEIGSEIGQRLSAIEDQLGMLTQKLGKVSKHGPAPSATSKRASASKPTSKRASAPEPTPKRASASKPTARSAGAKRASASKPRRAPKPAVGAKPRT